ncbi:MAG: thioredoxin-disulfide reductase [candidate division WOR-3 bacterium]|nr:thioredoxin-disulfide reductase [candidate division WOR-3 bacterium]
MNKKDYDLLIIGAGPAGLCAGIYGARAGLYTAILEKKIPGGTMTLTDLIENYPGFPDGVAGHYLGELMKKQCLKFGVEILNGEAKGIIKEGDVFYTRLENDTIRSRTIIIATGSSPRRLNIPGEEKFLGRGVSYCATCDGPLFKNRDIAIIGCGNSGLQEGRFLQRFVRSITFVEFLPRATADKILIDHFKDKENIQFLLAHEAIEIMGGSNVEGIKVRDRKTGEEKYINVNGVFIYVGLIPNTQFVKDTLEMDEQGFIITDEELNTSISGIFAAGDVRAKKIRQVVVACSEGAQAAINAYHFLNR